MSSLKSISIRNCPKFLSAYKASGSSSCCPFPSSLQNLHLSGRMEGMETLAPLSNIYLEHLSFNNWGEDLRFEDLWPLLTRGQLSGLGVSRSPKFFVLPDEQEQSLLSCLSKPLKLWTDDVAGVLAAPICSLLSSSLTNLVFEESNEVERFTEEQEEALPLLTSLKLLRFDDCRKLQRLPKGLNKLTNLETLEITYCPAIRSLPKNGLPSSLQELDVISCCNEQLKQRCRQLKGTIPRIIVDYII